MISRRATVLVITGLLICATGCTRAERERINRRLAAPPVDLRAVPGGVEVGFVCGAGVPRLTSLVKFDPPYLHFERDLPTKGVQPTRTVVIPVSEEVRHVRLDGFVMLADLYQTGVPFGFYRFTFRYSDLPRDKPERIPGGSCDRRVEASK